MWKRRDTILPAGIDRQQIASAGTETIIGSILEYFGCTISDIKNRSRKLDLVVSRHMAHYFLTVNPSIPLREMSLVTGFDHTSVNHSRKVVEDWMETDKGFMLKVHAIANLIINNKQKQTMQRIQIVGKVTGLNLIDAKTKFKESQNFLEERGYEVVNPMQIVPLGSTWHEAMRICVKSLLEVDAIAVQADWVDSKGAQAVYLLATTLNMKIIRI